MLSKLFNLFANKANIKRIKELEKKVVVINSFEKKMSELSDDELKKKTSYFRDLLKNGKKLEDILEESFAVVREAAKRTIGLRHYDVQLLGGIIIHNGNIAEMATGEGKTLVATCPVYLNALESKGVHIVTVNEYLSKRDGEWMGEIYRFLGLSVGIISSDMDNEEKKEEYAKDITFATNNELGFDFLRDNLKLNPDDIAQRGYNFAIIDEIDSILIDEARTPLIISGAANDNPHMYKNIDRVAKKIPEKYLEKDEKQKSCTLTEDGLKYIENVLENLSIIKSGNLYDPENSSILHHLNQAITAHNMYEREKDYILEKGDVIIIDEFTGRKMEGRRFSNGLHQAIEAKESVKINKENQTIASITFQNYFRMYNKLSGMTGTAETESEEFEEIYGLGVVSIPTNVPNMRKDNEDDIFRTSLERDDAVIEKVRELYEKGQPVLLGTASIEKSEHFAKLLKKANIKHNVLNAKNHEKEAEIIKMAGKFKAVTIATNMAGRGTDIKLGGFDAVKEEYEKVINAGGLFVLGTERHDSRRIDNQLRGRTGRQGDVGESKFYLSLEDDLMRIFGSNKLGSMLKKLGLKEGESITHPWITKALEKAQKKVEAHNFDIRKHLIKYDDITNDQRKTMFKLRNSYMKSSNIISDVDDIRHGLIEDLVNNTIPENSTPGEWKIDEVKFSCSDILNIDVDMYEWVKEDDIFDQKIFDRIKEKSDKHMLMLRENANENEIKYAYSMIALQILDHEWKSHLLNMDYLRQGIGLRAYGQKDPLNEYKREAFTLFGDFLNSYNQSITRYLSRVSINQEEAEASKEKKKIDNKVSRNAKCPCDSGMKYKHCCGKE